MIKTKLIGKDHFYDNFIRQITNPKMKCTPTIFELISNVINEYPNQTKHSNRPDHLF
jgi:hypothetical protein